MRNTIQKQVILDAVQTMHNHPTAEEIYLKISSEHPYISKATVYRNLNLLAENKTILRVKLSDGADRYDFNVQKHYHMRCKNCGKVYDAPISYYENLEKQLKDSYNFTIESHIIEFIGVCADCKS